MSEITFLASSKRIVMPREIEEYNNRNVFEQEEDVAFFRKIQTKNGGTTRAG